MSRLPIIAFFNVCLTLLGCATVKVETSGSAMKNSLCQVGTEKLSIFVFWGPKWRPDQKQPELREAAALRGIENFFDSLSCISNVTIRRLSKEEIDNSPLEKQLIELPAGAVPVPNRVILIIVRELGPKLLIGLPLLIQGGTEVALEVRVIDTQTSKSLANTFIQWQNGGAFVIKGVKTLDHDMSITLRTILMPKAFPE